MEQKEQNEHEMVKLRRHITGLNWIVLVALTLICAIAIKDMVNTTKSTKALSDVAQRVGVDFPTKTNTVFWTWHIVKPR